MRSDGLAAWVNDWVVEDRLAQVRIGSNSQEWMRDEEYDPTMSTLYGSYALYCQQTNRSAKSPQNFSAELLELTNRSLGWGVLKERVKMAGTSVRVIKGLRLRTPGDDKPTVEEKLEEDMRGTGDDSPLKVESNGATVDEVSSSKESAPKEKVESFDSLLPTFYFLLPTLLGDNLHQIKKEEKINLSSPENNQPSKVTGGEEKRNIPTLNLTRVC